MIFKDRSRNFEPWSDDEDDTWPTKRHNQIENKALDPLFIRLTESHVLDIHRHMFEGFKCIVSPLVYGTKDSEFHSIVVSLQVPRNCNFKTLTNQWLCLLDFSESSRWQFIPGKTF
ncbi:hypothetical protein AVEN_263284-1 [Araneus ventricosus]|uniref:Uncharacterized protein n=1 Tax=Araneus ventricosus TaxID=182803 RepID=A0A4Y2HHG0_ARAVE|nr:hypothetical protein AVEN_263284-1 [Araneus ventricosus]